MAEVALTIGERRHVVACRDGEEARVRQLGDLLDARWPAGLRAAGGSPGERAMLFVALMLADALLDAEARRATIDDSVAARIADQLEALADTLEQRAPSA